VFLSAFQEQTSYAGRFFQPFKSRLLTPGVSFGLSAADFLHLAFLLAFQQQTSYIWRFFWPSKSRLLTPGVSFSLSRADFSENACFLVALPPPNDKHNPPRGCGENPFASKLPESAWLRRWHARKRGRVDAMLGGVFFHSNVIVA